MLRNTEAEEWSNAEPIKGTEPNCWKMRKKKFKVVITWVSDQYQRTLSQRLGRITAKVSQGHKK